MYIFECLWKLFHKEPEDTDEFDYDPLNPELETEDYERCEHEFMPVDSTAETLACIKCGFIVKRSNIEEDNYDSNN